MNTDQIRNAVEQLRAAANDGPATRKLLDALFRHVHNLKARASANGLHNLAAAAHEFENVLHAMRTRAADISLSDAIPADVWKSLKQAQKHTLQQSLAEGAKLFLVDASFDVGDFDREYQRLKEALTKSGEVISTSPRTDSERRRKVNFRILYAQKSEAALSNTPNISVEEISVALRDQTAKAGIDLEAIERAFEELSAELTNLPEVSGEDVFEQAVRAGRSAALATGKEVDFELRIHDLNLDRRLSETIADPLIHLVRNAAAHGIEPSEERLKLEKNPRGKILIEATRENEQIRITVTDDGRGIDPASLQQIFQPGFSTASELSETSGRGVGLDAVKTDIEHAGGSITVTTRRGHGSTFEITLPAHTPIRSNPRSDRC